MTALRSLVLLGLALALVACAKNGEAPEDVARVETREAPAAVEAPAPAEPAAEDEAAEDEAEETWEEGYVEAPQEARDVPRSSTAAPAPEVSGPSPAPAPKVSRSSAPPASKASGSSSDRDLGAFAPGSVADVEEPAEVEEIEEEKAAAEEDIVPVEAPKPAAPATLDIDAFIESLPDEAIVFNVPEQVDYGSLTQVRLIIQPGVAEAELVARFERERGEAQTGGTESLAVPTSEEMGATLVSSGLEITALRPERQFLSRREPTEWLWDVRAINGGPHTLVLTLYAIPPGRSSGRTIEVYERRMEVVVPVTDQVLGAVEANWEWLWTFLLAPVGGWLLARRRRAREELDA
ncbi:MAG: hypothetical protein H6739_41395 [Alphaproteobacteria bacterium]|nr:hypothetical protein [Alphaproteobacteria bacterium]